MIHTAHFSPYRQLQELPVQPQLYKKEHLSNIQTNDPNPAAVSPVPWTGFTHHHCYECAEVALFHDEVEDFDHSTDSLLLYLILFILRLLQR